jgi:hypothetical protein
MGARSRSAPRCRDSTTASSLTLIAWHRGVPNERTSSVSSSGSTLSAIATASDVIWVLSRHYIPRPGPARMRGEIPEAAAAA